jgi:hypothetical protein
MKANNPHKKRKINQPLIRSINAFIIFVICALAAAGLSFTKAWNLSRVFFLASILASLAALCYYMVKLHNYTESVKRAYAQALKATEKTSGPALLPPEDIGGADKPIAETVVKKDVPAENEESVKPTEPIQQTRQDDEREREEVSALKFLLKNLEEKHVNVFEQKVQDSEDMSKDGDALLEELLDIALLSMDLANIYNRRPVSYSEIIKQLVMKDRTKNQVLRQMDGSIRLSKKYAQLSRLIHKYLPDSSFFYSGYKL